MDKGLRNSSISIVLSTIKIFLNYTQDKEKIQKQVYEKIRVPLVTLVKQGEISGSNETSYIILSHIKYITIRGGSNYFEKEYKHFYCLAEDPGYIKKLKIAILEKIASDENLGDILNELGEYVTDID